MTEEAKALLNIYETRVKTIKKNSKCSNIQFLKEIEKYNNFADIMNENDFKEILRFKRNRRARRKRANKKLLPLIDSLNPKIVFGTCTFNNAQFFTKNGKEISERARTRKVNKWLQRHFKYSVVNIDYGLKNEREHHHFVGEPNDDVLLIPVLNENGIQKKSKKGHLIYNLDLKNQDYNIGFEPDIEIVNYDKNDYTMKHISNYLLKVNNHINKKTTKNRRFRVLKGEVKESQN